MGDHKYTEYVSKKYSAKMFLGALRFDLVSEDRQNGEYKHMLSIALFGNTILSLIYRTGKTEEGTNMSIGIFRFRKTFIDYTDETPLSESVNPRGYTTTVWRKGNLRVTRTAGSFNKGDA